MNVVNSSGWLEYLVDGPNAGFFTGAVEDVAQLVVPSLSLYEVFKRVLLQRGAGDALQAAAQMMQGQVVDLDSHLALSAARLSVNLGLLMNEGLLLEPLRLTSGERTLTSLHAALRSHARLTSTEGFGNLRTSLT